MNTDKIYAEQLANEYAPKDTSKVIALRKLDARAKLPATIFTYTFGMAASLITGVGMCLSKYKSGLFVLLPLDCPLYHFWFFRITNHRSCFI